MNCKHCSIPFIRSNHRQIFCSSQCKIDYHSKQRFSKFQKCGYCKTPFKPRNKLQKFCCKKCKDNFRYHQNVKSIFEQEEIKCDLCKKEWCWAIKNQVAFCKECYSNKFKILLQGGQTRL